MTDNDMRYFPVVRDGAMWLVVQLSVDGGPGVVLGRWDSLARAEYEACRWYDLEGSTS